MILKKNNVFNLAAKKNIFGFAFFDFGKCERFERPCNYFKKIELRRAGAEMERFYSFLKIT